MSRTPRIATKAGIDVRDPTEDIKEELLAGIIVGLGEDFEATHTQWAEGVHKAFQTILEPIDSVSRQEARNHLISLLQKGDNV